MKSCQLPLLLPVVSNINNINSNNKKWQAKFQQFSSSAAAASASIQLSNKNYNANKSKQYINTFEQFAQMMRTRNVTQRLMRRFPLGETSSLIYLNEMPLFVKVDLIHAAILRLRAEEFSEREQHKEHVTHTNAIPLLDSNDKNNKKNSIYNSIIEIHNKELELYNKCLRQLTSLNAPRAEVAHAAFQYCIHRERNKVKLMSYNNNVNNNNTFLELAVKEPLLALPIAENEHAAIGLCLHPHINHYHSMESTTQPKTAIVEVNQCQPSLQNDNVPQPISCTICVNTLLSAPRVDYRSLPQLYMLAIPIYLPHPNLGPIEKECYNTMRERAIASFLQSHLVYDSSSQQLLLWNKQNGNLTKQQDLQRRETEDEAIHKGNNKLHHNSTINNTFCNKFSNNERDLCDLFICVNKAFLVQGYNFSPSEAVQAAIAQETHSSKDDDHNTIVPENKFASLSTVISSRWQYHLFFLSPSSAASVHSVLGISTNNSYNNYHSSSSNSANDPAGAVCLSETSTLYPSLFVNHSVDIPAPSHETIYKSCNLSIYSSSGSDCYKLNKLKNSAIGAIPLQMKKLRFAAPLLADHNTTLTKEREYTSTKSKSLLSSSQEEELIHTISEKLESKQTQAEKAKIHLWTSQSETEAAYFGAQHSPSYGSKDEVLESRNVEMNELQIRFAKAQEKLIREQLLSYNSAPHRKTDNVISTEQEQLTKNISATTAAAAAKLADTTNCNESKSMSELFERHALMEDAERIPFVPFTVAEIVISSYAHRETTERQNIKEKGEEREWQEELEQKVQEKEQQENKQLSKLVNSKHANNKIKKCNKASCTNCVSRTKQTLRNTLLLPPCLQTIELASETKNTKKNVSLLAPNLWRCLNKTALHMWAEVYNANYNQTLSSQLPSPSLSNDVCVKEEEVLPTGLENLIEARESIVLPFLRRPRKLSCGYFMQHRKSCCSTHHSLAVESDAKQEEASYKCNVERQSKNDSTCLRFVPMLWTMSEIDTLLGWTRYSSLFESKYGILRHLLSMDLYTLIGAAHLSYRTHTIHSSERLFTVQEPFLLIHDVKFVQRVLLPAMSTFYSLYIAQNKTCSVMRKMQYVCYRHQAKVERWFKLMLLLLTEKSVEQHRKKIRHHACQDTIKGKRKINDTNKSKTNRKWQENNEEQKQQQQEQSAHFFASTPQQKVPRHAQAFLQAMLTKRKDNKKNKNKRCKSNVKSWQKCKVGVIPIIPFLEWATLPPCEWSDDVTEMLQSTSPKRSTKSKSHKLVAVNDNKSFYSHRDLMRVLQYLLCYKDMFCLTGNDGTTVAFVIKDNKSSS